MSETMTEAERQAKIAKLDAESARLRAAAPTPAWARFVLERMPEARWRATARGSVACPGADEYGDSHGILMEPEVHGLTPLRARWLRAIADLADAIGRGDIPRPPRREP